MSLLRMDTIEINSINITTVCSLNNTEYQCTCNNPYSWPCEKCSRYGFCNNNKNNGTNSTCFCNNSIPYDGQVCQPISELLKNSTCPAAPPTVKDGLYQSNGNIYPGTDLNLTCTSPAPTNITWTLNGAKLNESSNILSLKNATPGDSGEYACKTTVNSVPYIIRQNITIQPYPDIKVTPDKVVECKITTITLQCCVQLVYEVEWNTTSCASTSRDPVTGCISCDYTVNDQQCQTNDQVAQFTCQLKNPINGSTNPDHKLKTIKINIPKPLKVLNLLLKINEEFDIELTNKSSTKYSNFKKQMENSIDESYSTVPGYKMNSITVTGFRSGSVIVDFTIQSTNANIDLISANQNLVQSLRTLGYNVSDDAFSHSVKDGLYQGSGNIYPGTDLNLNCTSPAPTDITWTLNGAKLPESSNILSLKNVTPLNSGEYACITTVNHLAYIIWQIITIQPYPDIQVTTDKIVACKITTIPLLCCVQLAYQVEWDTTQPECQSAQDPVTGCISCDYTVNNQQCQTNDQVAQFTCKLKNPISGFTNTAQNLKTIKLSITNREFACFNPIFGSGNVGDVQIGNCSENMVGFQVAQCSSSKIWQVTEDKCVLRIFNYFNVEAKTLQVTNLPQFMANVIVNATLEKENIVDSSATILTIVEILTIISNLSQTIVINKPVMTNFLEITDVIGSDGAQETWAFLNSKKDSMNASSELLNATESIARRLPDNDISITTNFSSLNKTSISAPFSGEFGQNLTTLINIPVSSAKTFLTVIISLVFNNILPVRNLTYNDSSQTGTSINGDVAMIETSSKINNISLSFNTKNKTLGSPQCVFWNFSLLDNVGGWDSTGCQLKTFGNELERYTCECSHTTSFSMLMSPFSPVNCALDIITYVGVGISMGSLVLCLIIEFIAWKFGRRNEKFYQRHVAIINIAVSLLIANICFIIAAAVVKKEVNQCSTATFFMHFFYLAVFFWILLLALLLLLNVYTIVPIMTTKTMMGIAFSVGYGAPLLIAVITVASTAGRNGYIQRGYNCWLNWNETKALLAFVIPALTIVAINLLVLVVVLCKIFIRPVTAHMSRTEKNPLLVIARCVAILTPLFGLTWGFGIGTLVSPECGIHIVFAFLNSLQGFFILVFGTLMDHKVREVLAQKLALRSVSSGTRTTSGGPTSSSGFNVFQRFRQRNGYNVASDENFSSSN